MKCQNCGSTTGCKEYGNNIIKRIICAKCANESQKRIAEAKARREEM